MMKFRNTKIGVRSDIGEAFLQIAQLYQDALSLKGFFNCLEDREQNVLFKSLIVLLTTCPLTVVLKLCALSKTHGKIKIN